MQPTIFPDVWDHPTTAKADARGCVIEELLAIEEALTLLKYDAGEEALAAEGFAAAAAAAVREATESEVRTWLDTFAAAVRALDYSAGEQLFASGVVGFGTVAAHLTGRDALAAQEWKRAWAETLGFRFDLGQLTCGIDGDMAWVAVPWSGRSARIDSGPNDLTGRATYVLQRRAGRWLCVHCHHSVAPAGGGLGGHQ